MILTWISYVLTFLLGYVIGINFCVKVTEKAGEKLQDTYKRVRQKIVKTKLGGIERIPYSEQIKKGTRLEETEKAMEETLEDVL